MTIFPNIPAGDGLGKQQLLYEPIGIFLTIPSETNVCVVS